MNWLREFRPLENLISHSQSSLHHDTIGQKICNYTSLDLQKNVSNVIFGKKRLIAFHEFS